MVEYTIRGRETADTTDSLLGHLLIVRFPGAGEEELAWSWGVRETEHLLNYLTVYWLTDTATSWYITVPSVSNVPFL